MSKTKKVQKEQVKTSAEELFNPASVKEISKRPVDYYVYLSNSKTGLTIKKGGEAFKEGEEAAKFLQDECNIFHVASSFRKKKFDNDFQKEIYRTDEYLRKENEVNLYSFGKGVTKRGTVDEITDLGLNLSTEMLIYALIEHKEKTGKAFFVVPPSGRSETFFYGIRDGYPIQLHTEDVTEDDIKRNESLKLNRHVQYFSERPLGDFDGKSVEYFKEINKDLADFKQEMLTYFRKKGLIENEVSEMTETPVIPEKIDLNDNDDLPF